jgi:hypothetical protein
MEVIEEVARRRQTIKVDDPESAYAELRDLLNGRMKFSKVTEEKYFNDVDGKDLRAKIETDWHMDRFTAEVMEIFFHVDREANEVDIQIKAELETHYPDSKRWQGSLWYYAYRSLFDKFLYGHVRHGYEPAVEERVQDLMEKIRTALESDYHG